MSADLAIADWRALGTGVRVLVDRRSALAAARAAVEAELAAIDLACSRFREDSELARVNAAGGRPVSVSPLFLAALDAAVRAASLTDGAVDPTVGAALALAGYDRDFSLVADGVVAREHPVRIRLTRSPGVQAIRIDRERRTVAVSHGAQLDLGSTAKALAADRAATSAHQAAGAGVLVSLGGDVAVAGPPPASGWRVRVCEDHAAGPGALDQIVAIASGGLATSSTTVRRWRAGSEERHHIIDPTTGRPAHVVWRTATVAAGSCVDANAAATAAIVLGNRAPAWLEGRGLPARLISAGGRLLCVAAWPAQEAA